MLGRLFGLRLNIEFPFEPVFLFIISRHVEKPGKMLQFTFHVGVPQCRIPLAPAPKNISFTAKFVSNFHGLFYLGRCVGECVCVTTRCRAMHITRMSKETSRTPKQFYAR